MTKYSAQITWKVVAPALFIISSRTNAASLNFDCDVPPNHYSTISEDSNGPAAISGAVEQVELRSGYNLPVTGVRIDSSDGQDTVQLQLSANSPKSKQFEVFLSTKSGSVINRTMIGHVAMDHIILFSLAVSDKGLVKALVDDIAYSTQMRPVTTVKEMAFCSSGQFKLTNLLFSSSNDMPADANR